MKLYAAGAQNPAFLKTLEKARYPYILMSFYQIKKNPKVGRQKLAHAKSVGMEVLLDSGAHSFYNQFSHLDVRKKDARAQADRRFVKERKTSREDLIAECNAYMDEYVAFLVENKDIVPHYAELDIDTLVGLEQIRVWRRQFADAGLSPICTYHGSEEYLKAGGTKAFVKDIADLGFKYIGIAREERKNSSRLFFTENLAELKKHRILVHLWGMTEQRTWLDLAGFSVDSSVGGSSKVWVRKDGVVKYTSIRDLYEEYGETERRGVEGRALALAGTQTLTVVGSPDSGYRTAWAPLRSVVRHDVAKRRLRLTLRSGLALDVTADHSLFRMSPTGDLLAVTPAELRVGDWLVCPRSGLWGGGGLSEITANFAVPYGSGSRPLYRGSQGSFTFKLSIELLELFGFWIGDGSYGGETSVSFSCGIDAESRQRVQRWAASLGRKATVTAKTNDVRVSHLLAVRGMRAIGLTGYSFNKCLPEWFWSLSRQQACALLRGLFTADGTGGNLPYLATTSKQLALQVQAAVGALTGFTPSFSLCKTKGGFHPARGGRPGYRVTITSTPAKAAFVENIGFFLKRKTVPLGSVERGARTEEVPVSLALKELRYQNGCPALVASSRVARSTYPEAFHPAVLSPDLLYIPVVAIKDLGSRKTDVYDLEVPGVERFVANGVLAHNTSWLNGSKYGTTHVWVPGTMKMHLHDYKVKAKVRPRLKGYCEENGIDFAGFMAEDDDEVNLYHACQWRDFAKHVDQYTANAYWLTHDEKVASVMSSRKKTAASAAPAVVSPVETVVTEPVVVAAGKPVTPLAELIPSPGRDGKIARYEDPRTNVKMRCVDCYIKEKCPKFQPEEGALCVFPFQVKISSIDDLKAAMTALVESMLARTMHSVMVERVQGGVLDPNVSKELRENVALIRELKELFEAPRSRLTITAEGGAADGASKGGGLLASLFGNLKD